MSKIQQQVSNLNNSLKGDFAGKVRRANKLHTRDEMDYYNKFHRFGVINPYSHFGRSKEYIFFTRPDLQLLTKSGELTSSIANIPFFKDALLRYPAVMKQLQISVSNMPYINLLSNTVTSSLDLPSSTASEVENSSNIYGDTISYRWDSYASDVEHEFSLEFTDSKYLEVYMLFRIWDEYCSKKASGSIAIPENFVINKILHDQVSAYKIIVGEDGETILFFAKLFGVYPKSVPREAFSSLSEDGGLNLSVNFKAAFVEDMRPEIIDDFNEIFNNYNKSSKRDIAIYDKSNGVVNGEWVTIPHIVKASKEFGPGYRYKLKWR